MNKKERLSSSSELVVEDSAKPEISSDMKLCRMCLMAAIVFAFGKEALMFI